MSQDLSRFFTLASEAAEEEMRDSGDELKQDLWYKMGEELESNNFPKEKISQKIQNTIEEQLEKKLGYSVKINTAYYYRVMSKNNWQDSTLGRPRQTFPLGEIGNSSLYTGKIGPFTGENKEIVKSLTDFIQTIKLLRDYLHNNPFTPQIPKNVLDDILTRINAYNVNATTYLNNKQTVPLNSQMIFLECYNECSDINNLFGLYFDEIKRVHLENRKQTKKTNQILTSKELKKYFSRDLTKLQENLEFTSSNEAKLNGFYGQQCPDCKGYRTNVINGNSNKVYCVQCHNLRGKESFVREHYVICQRCKYIITSKDIKGKCPHCDLEMVIPVEMR